MKGQIIHQRNHGKITVGWDAIEGLDSEKTAARKRWEAYIAAMRGYFSSHPLDINKADAYYTRLTAEERFFAGHDRSKAARRAHLIQLLLSRVKT